MRKCYLILTSPISLPFNITRNEKEKKKKNLRQIESMVNGCLLFFFLPHSGSVSFFVYYYLIICCIFDQNGYVNRRGKNSLQMNCNTSAYNKNVVRKYFCACIQVNLNDH
jgi:hypothetical protein